MGSEVRSSSTSSDYSATFPNATFSNSNTSVPILLATSTKKINSFVSTNLPLAPISSKPTASSSLQERCIASPAITEYLTIIKSMPNGHSFLRTLDTNQSRSSNNNLQARLKTWIEDRNLISMMSHIFDTHDPYQELCLTLSEEDYLIELQDFSFDAVHKRANEFRTWIEKRSKQENDNQIPILKQIKFLDLRDCSLSSLPEEIVHFSGLEHLDLSNNMLITIPDYIKNLVNLKSFVAKNNKLKQLPEVLGNLTHVEKVDVSENELTNLPESIGEMTALAEIHTAKNKMDKNTKLPISYGKLSKLVHHCYEYEYSTEPSSSILSQIARPTCKNALQVSAADYLKLRQEAPSNQGSTQSSTSSTTTQTPAPYSISISLLITPPPTPMLTPSFSLPQFGSDLASPRESEPLSARTLQIPKALLPQISVSPMHKRALSASSSTVSSENIISEIISLPSIEETQTKAALSSSKSALFSEVQMSSLKLPESKSCSPSTFKDTDSSKDTSVKTETKMPFKALIKTVAAYGLSFYNFVKHLVMAF